MAICKTFLQTGSCPAGETCDLSHTPSPERSPNCLHFARGRCSNPDCRYAHVRPNPAAPVCRNFAILGYCDKGSECIDRHVIECPDYADKGSCSNKKCKLPHIDRAGQIRKIAAATANKQDSGKNNSSEEDDLSSDEELDEIDSDDVSSDEEQADEDEDMVIIDGNGDTEISQQDDYVGF